MATDVWEDTTTDVWEDTLTDVWADVTLTAVYEVPAALKHSGLLLGVYP